MTWAALLEGKAPPPTLRGTIRRNILADTPAEKKRAHSKADYWANPEKRKEYMRAWRKANLAKVREWQREYRKKHGRKYKPPKTAEGLERKREQQREYRARPEVKARIRELYRLNYEANRDHLNAMRKERRRKAREARG